MKRKKARRFFHTIFADPKRYQGVIVWDFDGVLFETERYRQDNRDGYARLGVRGTTLGKARDAIRKTDGHYSVERVLRELRGLGVSVSQKKAHAMHRSNLQSGLYYSPKTDALLHRMRKLGFRQFIVSFGNASYQYKKMFLGCGASFRKHFIKMTVTARQKYFTLLKIQKAYPYTPLFFVDDTKAHLELARRHVPGVVPIHYSNLGRKDLRHVERTIVRYAKKL